MPQEGDKGDSIEDSTKSFAVFLQDFRKVPCARDAFLWGLVGGPLVGILLLFKKNPATTRTAINASIVGGAFIIGLRFPFCMNTFSKKRSEIYGFVSKMNEQEREKKEEEP